MLKGGPTHLSKDVVAEINGYERRETEGDKLKYLIKADKATTFVDNHQELENAYFEIHNDKDNNVDFLNEIINTEANQLHFRFLNNEANKWKEYKENSTKAYRVKDIYEDLFTDTLNRSKTKDPTPT